jgi:hypothetical protein
MLALIKHPPTSINGLSPRSPVLRGLDTLNIGAPYHSVIGDRGRGDTPNSSDGVVGLLEFASCSSSDRQRV